MGQAIDKIPHGDCGSRRGLQVFVQDDDEITGYCFACSTFVKNPYGDDKPEGFRPEYKTKTQETINAEIAEIGEYPTVTLHDRRLNAGTLAYFGIKVGLSQADGATPESHHYPYYKEGVLRAYKNRIIETKGMWSVGEMKGVELFGWRQAAVTGARRLFITEGELDAAALHQMITRQQSTTQYADRIPAVVSLTRGCSNAVSDITTNIEKIRRLFKEVVLVFDQDEPGQKATEEVLKVAPDFMTVDLPEKDANACLLEGKAKACVDACMWKAAIPKNTSLVWGSSLHDAGRQEAQWGASYPWPALTAMTRGIRFGETVYIGAGVKMGKSEVVNALASHCILEHGWKTFVLP
jgi:twinkle protein